MAWRTISASDEGLGPSRMLPKANVAASRRCQSSGVDFLPMFSVTNGMTMGTIESCRNKAGRVDGRPAWLRSINPTDMQSCCAASIPCLCAVQHGGANLVLSVKTLGHTCAVRASRPRQVPEAMAMFQEVSSFSTSSSCFVSCCNRTGTRCGVTALMKLWLGCAQNRTATQEGDKGMML